MSDSVNNACLVTPARKASSKSCMAAIIQESCAQVDVTLKVWCCTYS